MREEHSEEKKGTQEGKLNIQKTKSKRRIHRTGTEVDMLA